MYSYGLHKAKQILHSLHSLNIVKRLGFISDVIFKRKKIDEFALDLIQNSPFGSGGRFKINIASVVVAPLTLLVNIAYSAYFVVR